MLDITEHSGMSETLPTAFEQHTQPDAGLISIPQHTVAKDISGTCKQTPLDGQCDARVGARVFVRADDARAFMEAAGVIPPATNLKMNGEVDVQTISSRGHESVVRGIVTGLHPCLKRQAGEYIGAYDGKYRVVVRKQATGTEISIHEDKLWVVS